MEHSYLITIYYFNGKERRIEGLINYFSRPVPGAHEKLRKLKKVLDRMVEKKFIRRWSIIYES